MIQRISVILLFILTGIFPCIAQEVEFEIPEEISIVPGQLSVVFNEDITEERARALIKSMHYEVLEVKFSPLQIIAHAEAEISDETVKQLNDEKSIDSAVRYSDSLVNEEGEIISSGGSMKYAIAITFHDGTTQAKAKKTIKKHLSLTTARVIALPREIIIQVGENDEEAFDVIQNQKGVRWVSYVGTAEDF